MRQVAQTVLGRVLRAAGVGLRVALLRLAFAVVALVVLVVAELVVMRMVYTMTGGG